MKTKSFIQQLCRSRLLAGALALFITISTASAALLTYTANWSGASFGNGASARATVVIDDSLLQNPGSIRNSFDVPGSAVTDFSITVIGASAGNGTFVSGADFGDYILVHECPAVTTTVVIGCNLAVSKS